MTDDREEEKEEMDMEEEGVEEDEQAESKQQSTTEDGFNNQVYLYVHQCASLNCLQAAENNCCCDNRSL